MEISKHTVESFVSKTLHLLEKERAAEIEETRSLTEKLPSKELQRRGVCLLKLHIGSRKTGLFGRVILSFETHLETLPSHSFSPGDIVGLNISQGDSQSDSLGSGLVTRVSQSAVNVAFDESHDLFSLDDGPTDYYKLTKLANDVTYKRLKRTLENLNKIRHGECANLVSVLFEEQPLSPPNNLQDLKFINENLDESQQQAVQFALAQKELAVVHGPPGTGKTTTVIEIILQAVKQGNKILACAPSNIAVDNLVERLAKCKHRIVRLGHPARLLPHIQKYSLDAILSTSDETKLVEDVRKDLDKTLSGLKKTKNKGERQKLREEMKFLRKELRQRADAATRDILKRADVVLVTLTSATDDGPMKLLEESHFDVTIIDEVSQAMEAACWIPLLRTKKCILAGDHLQLPPTILSNEAAKEGLAVTLMERVLDLYGEKVMKMLTTQYRMNEKIMQWSSHQLYESKLVAHESVKHHLLKDMPGITQDETSILPLLYIDTAGCDLRELDLPEEISKGNEGEADLVSANVEKLLSCGVNQEDIAVIAPYNLQVELVRLRLASKYPKIEVKSVDGFQGREKEAVIISLVRSNKRGEVGFLSERRRINVAVTRARRHLTVIGDSETVCKDDFLKSLIDYLNLEADVQTAQQYLDDGVLQQCDINRPEHLDDLMVLSKKQGSDKGARPKSYKQNMTAKHGERRQKESQQQERNTQGSKRDPVSEDDSRLIELQGQIEQFLSNNEADILEFPSTLSGRDRFLVHEVAEKQGLAHTSKGTGDDRFIVVTKPGIRSSSGTTVESGEKGSVDKTAGKENEDKGEKGSVDQTMEKDSEDKGEISYQSRSKKNKKKKKNNENIEIDENVENDEGAVDPLAMDVPGNRTDGMKEFIAPPLTDGKVVCNICKKDVLKANLQLHEIHCARKERDCKLSKEEKVDVSNKQKKEVSKSSKHRKFDKELAERVEKVDKDDIDALIETVQNMDNFCCFKKCKTSVQTLFQLCAHCQGRYCLTHHIPEVHGCGEAARAQARARISKDGVLYRGSGVPEKRPDSTKKAHLHRKLDSKLTELAAKRKGKPKK
ncbi:DNA-binding protein SMUBP-2-like [Mercenaria mercenaria]|uniref:DNA-binding protein SMUBP-2-like n=1 Tax=Mercenaria mercenaria TaxID=6596 RepID=UPI00234E4179|nr:DNA-binding protein SMUBP-2-like [Mercenaria mercenaria]